MLNDALSSNVSIKHAYKNISLRSSGSTTITLGNRNDYNNIIYVNSTNGSVTIEEIYIDKDDQWTIYIPSTSSRAQFLPLEIYYYDTTGGLPSSKSLSIKSTGSVSTTYSKTEMTTVVTKSLGFDATKYMYCVVNGSFAYSSSYYSGSSSVTVSNAVVTRAGSGRKFTNEYADYIFADFMFDNSNFYIKFARDRDESSSSITKVSVTSCNLTAVFH